MLSQTDTRVVLPIGPIFIDRKIDRIEIYTDGKRTGGTVLSNLIVQ